MARIIVSHTHGGGRLYLHSGTLVKIFASHARAATLHGTLTLDSCVRRHDGKMPLHTDRRRAQNHSPGSRLAQA